MKRIKEKETLTYVVATLAQDGKTMYVFSDKERHYMLTDDIQIANKASGKTAAKWFYDFAKMSFGSDVELVLLPLITTYELVDENDDSEPDND